MEYFGWIVFGVFLASGAYLLYAVEKKKPWARQYIGTLASIDPEMRRFHKHPVPPTRLPEDDPDYHRYINPPWWIYL